MNSSNKNIVIYSILLLGLFVLLFFTKDYYFDYSTKSTNIEELEIKTNDLEAKINKLEKNKKTLEKSIGKPLKIAGKEIKRDLLDKYIVNFTENNFLEYFYGLDENIAIEKITLDKGKLDKNGFIKGKIDLGVVFNSEDQMKEFLSKIISKDSKYKFYIENFKFPIGKMDNGKETKINISLTIYYKNQIKENKEKNKKNK